MPHDQIRVDKVAALGVVAVAGIALVGLAGVVVAALALFGVIY